MSEKTFCVVCNEEITEDDWAQILAEHSDVFMTENALGTSALTENQQVLTSRMVHSDCYYELN